MKRWVWCWMLVIGLLAGRIDAQDASSARTIIIGTWNVQRLGEKDDPDRIGEIAKICRGIDLLAIQEVHPGGSDAVQRLAGEMGPEYVHAVSDETTWERFAFIWRSPVQSIEAPGLMEQPRLGRKPFRGQFRAGNFDFQIINLHLFWDGSKKTYPHTRSVELKLLDDWMCDRDDHELDLLLVGDFNSPGVFYDLQFPPPLSPHFHFYELLNRHDCISVSIDRGIPTSIANDSLYDHIIFNPSVHFVEEFAGMDEVEIHRWDLAWDRDGDQRLDWDEHTRARTHVTDHRLVTARFRIDLPDDDGEGDAVRHAETAR